MMMMDDVTDDDCDDDSNDNKSGDVTDILSDGGAILYLPRAEAFPELYLRCFISVKLGHFNE